MRDQEWDSAPTQLYSLDLSKLVLSLCSLDSVNSESTLRVVDESEVLASLVDGDHIHETSWVVGVCSDLCVDLDQSLHNDLGDFSTIESILQSVAEENDEWETVALFVRTWRRLWCIGTRELVKQPVGWR